MFDKFPFILDGATGTELQKLGMPAGTCSEKWVLENPEALKTIQRAYIDAGSDAVYAATFGANRHSLRAHGVTDSVPDVCRRLVDISREAAAGRALVIGDMAPTGLQLFPVGSITFDGLADIYAEQASALHNAGVDFFGIETQMSLGEARAAVTAVRSVSDRPVIASFSCGPGGMTLFGGDLCSALVSLQELGVSAFGINCCGDLDIIIAQLARMRRYSAIPLISKPNAGIPDISGDGSIVYHMTPQELAGSVPLMAANGARLFGGCCGTTSEHIAAIKQALSADAPPELSPVSAWVCASEYRLVEISGSTEFAELEITEDLSDDAVDALADGADVIKLTLRDDRDVAMIAETQYAIRLPLCISCDDRGLLDIFRRVYNGKALIL